MADAPQASPPDPPPKTSAAATKADQDAEWEAAQATGDADWLARQEATAAEYGMWVATATIPIGGVAAFHAGHAVPISHVEKYGLDRRTGTAGPLVVKRDSSEGRAVLEQTGA